MTRKSVLILCGISLLAVSSFISGFYTCLHWKSAASGEVSHRNMLHSGDAPISVRLGVLASLRGFQEGYVRRDTKELDAFMNRLFPKSDDILLLGTDAGEWVRGYSAVSSFIGEDWQKWGDFRFSVEDSTISSSGDVAWIATTGAVYDGVGNRPVRFSAMLTRSGNEWLFRQLQFQWDYRDPRLTDFLHPNVCWKLGKLCLQRVGLMIRSLGQILPLAGVQTP